MRLPLSYCKATIKFRSPIIKNMNFSIIIGITLSIGLPIYLGVIIAKDFLKGSNKFFEIPGSKNFSTRSYYVAGSLIWFLSLWQTVTSTGLADPTFIPSPQSVIVSFIDLWRNGNLIQDILITLSRILFGFLSAAILGSILGILSGSFNRLSALIIPLNSLLRYIPPTAYLGLFVLWFGLDEFFKIALVFIGIFFYVIVMTSDEVSRIRLEYIDIARTLGAKRHDLLWRVIIPASMPNIIDVWKVNMGQAWIMVIIAEYVSSSEGLGHIIRTSQRFLNTPRLFAILIIIGIIGVILDQLFSLSRKLLFPWDRG